ncbi:MAG: DUF3365 domain-containing protein [Chlorobi bacterium]|nr:DUF3365 domain-containing protein [Chlorobiota bacterium]
MLKRIMQTAGVVVLLVAVAGCSSPKQSGNAQSAKEKYLANARTIATGFQKELSSVLKKHLLAGGPAEAIAVCADTAQELTRAFGESRGATIRRVTSKPRNPADAPDDFEKAILEEFADLKQEGRLTAKSEYFEIVEIDGKKIARYLKPLTVVPVCLKCHGQNLSPEVTSLLKERYPSDKAVGYKTGDLRGAISIMIDVE